MKPASPAEERVLRSLRQGNVITADQFRTCLDLLEATQPCDRCGESGREPSDPNLPCAKCTGTGQMYVLR